MMQHSRPGEKGFAVLKEAVYQNTCTYRKQAAAAAAAQGPGGLVKRPSSNCSYTVSPGTRHHLYSINMIRDSCERESEQNIPPAPDVPPPLPPKRTTSLLGTSQRHKQSLRESMTMNPKRISIATSTFWEGHPDLGHFVSGWELGRDKLETSSVWGTTERGGTESVNLWGDPPAVKKGILLQQRDKLWSRWKERYCILTRDYLHCFRRTTSLHRSGVRLSDMGTFIFKLRLADIDTIDWESRKSGPMIAIHLPQESRLLIRTPCDTYEALQEWHTLLQECVYMSKERRQALRNHHNISATSTTASSSQKSTISTNHSGTGTGSGSSTGGGIVTSSGRNRDSSGKIRNGSDGSPNSSTKSSNQSTHSGGSLDNVSTGRESICLNPVGHGRDRGDEEDLGPVMLRMKDDKGGKQQIWRSSVHESSGFVGLQKNNNARLSLKLTSSNGGIDKAHKYIPTGGNFPEDENYSEEDDEINDHFPVTTRQRCSRASIAGDGGGATFMPSARFDGPSMTLHDFVKNPWKNMRNIGSNSRDYYGLPAVAPSRELLRHRPESWNPGSQYRNNLQNNHSTNNYSQKGNSNWDKSGVPGNSSQFSRGRDSIYSTSRHTSEITFRKMS